MRQATRARAVGWAGLALAVSAVIVACSPLSTANQTAPPSREEFSPTVNCQALASAIVARDRTGDTSSATNGDMESLRQNCSNEYSIVTDYFSMVIGVAEFGPEPCESWSGYDVRAEAVELLREDGLCFSETASTPLLSDWPEGGLGWDEAVDHAGSYGRVCGPVQSVRDTDYAVFINIGIDYPSPDRFTFILWDYTWLEPINKGAVVCGSGDISLHEGVAQIALATPADIEIWE